MLKVYWLYQRSDFFPYKPRFRHAILSATRYGISEEKEGWLLIQSGWQPGTITICFHMRLKLNALPVQNILFSTDFVITWGVCRSSRKTPELLIDSSGPPWWHQTCLIFKILNVDDHTSNVLNFIVVFCHCNALRQQVVAAPWDDVSAQLQSAQPWSQRDEAKLLLQWATFANSAKCEVDQLSSS